MKTLLLTLIAVFSSLFLYGQILSGPMLGNNTMFEVQIWLQTEEDGAVYAKYWRKGLEEDTQTSESVDTRFKNARVAHLDLMYLYPGTEYEYQIFFNEEPASEILTFETQALWQYRTDPPEFSFTIGSCHYTNDEDYNRPGNAYGDTSLQIFQSIREKQSDFMLWLGDNIYLRAPDYDSRSGIYYRYTQYKSTPELQELWKSMPHYAIWDDHDFGPNNRDRAWVHKDLNRQAFKDFWANPSYGQNDEGIYTAFRWGDCEFFLLDNRYFRTPNDLQEEERTALGAQQLQWLLDNIISSQASFKFVALGGQFLNPSAVYENMATYEQDRNTIIEFIQKNQIRNVIFLTGDRHRTELSQLNVEGMPVIYDLTCSPLTSGTHDERAPEFNTYRIEGTKVAERNFATLSLSGPFRNRVLYIQTFDKTGKQIWDYTIPMQGRTD